MQIIPWKPEEKVKLWKVGGACGSMVKGSGQLGWLPPDWPAPLGSETHDPPGQ